MTITAHAGPATTGWLVHVEVELSPVADGSDPADRLAMALLTRSGDRGAAVVMLDDVVRVTWSRPAQGEHSARRALVEGVDATLELITRHVHVERVRLAWLEPDPLADGEGAPQAVGAVATAA